MKINLISTDILQGLRDAMLSFSGNYGFLICYSGGQDTKMLVVPIRHNFKPVNIYKDPVESIIQLEKFFSADQKCSITPADKLNELCLEN